MATFNPKRVFIYSYNEYSEGAKALAVSLGIKRIKHEGSHFHPRSFKTVINWGASDIPDFGPDYTQWPDVLNRPERTKEAGNKLKFFDTMLNASNCPRIPEWAIDKATANEMLSEGHTIVARTILTGHSGNGIIIVEPGQELPDAPLYVEYIPKKEEYRIHIVKGDIIDIQRKVRDPDKEPTNWKVRSHQNGFIFIRGGVSPSSDVIQQAILAVNASGLDFGAVDVIWNEKQQKSYVLEINCAPGLEGQTVVRYSNAIRKIFE